jgi:hypothetical protein
VMQETRLSEQDTSGIEDINDLFRRRCRHRWIETSTERDEKKENKKARQKIKVEKRNLKNAEL